MSKKNAVVKKKETGALALNEEIQALLVEEANTGLENVTADDLMIPFIGLLQALSPQINKRDPKYINGAEPGHFFNTVTEEVFDGEVGTRIIPVHFEKIYNEWIPRSEGGGFVASHATEREAMENRRKDRVTDIIDTANHYVMIEDNEGNWQWAVLSMTSTKLKVSRRWLSRQSMLKVEIREGVRVTPPTYATVWRLSTVEEKNDKGTFYNFKIEYEGLADNMAIVEEAKNFRESILGGAARADYTKMEDEVAVIDDEPDF